MLSSDESSTLLCISSMAEPRVSSTVCNRSTSTELEAVLLFHLTKRSVNNCCPELVAEDPERFVDLYVVALAL